MPVKFNERLAQLLKANGLTQKALAEKVGVTEAAMSHYLKGDRRPQASLLWRMAAALGTTADDLMGAEKRNPRGKIEEAQRLIARNVRQMTKKEKMDIIATLMSAE